MTPTAFKPSPPQAGDEDDSELEGAARYVEALDGLERVPYGLRRHVTAQQPPIGRNQLGDPIGGIGWELEADPL